MILDCSGSYRDVWLVADFLTYGAPVKTGKE